MESEWPVLTLQEAGVLLIDCEHRTPRADESGYPYVAIPQMKNGRLDLSEARRISRDDFAEWTKKAVPQGFDVVLSRRCNPGETAFVEPGVQFALGQNLVLLRADGSKVYPPFLRWLVRSREWWEQIGTFLNMGAVFDSLKCADIPTFRLSIPPLPVQEGIAEILGTLDDKIDLNRRMNATLEAMARALFQAWFVEFEPVRENAASPTKHPLFPSAFQDSPVGRIPWGWKLTSLGETLAVLETGNRPKGGVQGIAHGIPSIGAESIVGIGRYDFGKTKYVPLEFFEALARGKLQSRDVLLYKDGGRPGEFEPHVSMFGDGFPFHRCCINEHVYRLRAAPSLSQELLYFWLESDSIMQEMRNRGTGVAVPGLNSTAVRALPVLVPPKDVVDGFTGFVDPLVSLILANSKESRTLAAVRDALLPRLMSGEIRLKMAQQPQKQCEGSRCSPSKTSKRS